MNRNRNRRKIDLDKARWLRARITVRMDIYFHCETQEALFDKLVNLKLRDVLLPPKEFQPQGGSTRVIGFEKRILVRPPHGGTTDQ